MTGLLDQTNDWLCEQDDQTLMAWSYMQDPNGTPRFYPYCPAETKQHFGMTLDPESGGLVAGCNTPVPFPPFEKVSPTLLGIIREMACMELGIRNSKQQPIVEWADEQIANWLTEQDDHTVTALAHLELESGLVRFSVCCPPETESHFNMELDYNWFALAANDETPVPLPPCMEMDEINVQRLHDAACAELKARIIGQVVIFQTASIQQQDCPVFG